MTTGFTRWRDWEMVFSISGGAVAVRAMKGALVSALNLPSLENDVLKSWPLKCTFKPV